MRGLIRVYGQEMRKIWRLPALVIIILIVLMWGWLLRQEIFSRHSPSQIQYGSNEHIELRVFSDLYEEYGDKLTAENRLDAEKFYVLYAADADEAIADDLRFAEQGIYSGQDLYDREKELEAILISKLPGEHNEEFINEWNANFKLRSELYYNLGPQTDWAAGRIMMLRTILGQYDYYAEHGISGVITSDKQYMYYHKYKSDPYMNLFPQHLVEMTREYYSGIIPVAVIAMGVLLLPVLINDRNSRVVAMQYSSRAGRRTIRMQFIAAIISAFILSMLVLGLFTAMFIVKVSDMYESFYSANISTVIVSYGNPVFLWFDLTYMQYLASCLFLSVLISMSAAVLFWVLSAFCVNYIILILLAIPVAAILSYIGAEALTETLFMSREGIMFAADVPALEFFVFGVMLLLGIVMYVIMTRYVRRKDLC